MRNIKIYYRGAFLIFMISFLEKKSHTIFSKEKDRVENVGLFGSKEIEKN